MDEGIHLLPPNAHADSGVEEGQDPQRERRFCAYEVVRCMNPVDARMPGLRKVDCGMDSDSSVELVVAWTTRR